MSSIKLKGDTSGEITIQAPSVAGTNTLNLQASSGTLATTAQASIGMKNLIINGDMAIDQRNNGASVAINGTTYSLDRIKNFATQTGKFTVQQNAGSVTPPAGFSNYVGATSSSAYSVTNSDYFLIAQAIEGLNTSRLNWGTANAKTVTLSFWVRSSLTGTFGGNVGNNNGTRGYPFTYTIDSANTWEYKTVTIEGETSGTWLETNGIGIQLYFSLGAGSTYSGTAGAWSASNLVSATGATSLVGTSGATFYITGVQLEVGTTATPFENRMYSTELAMCQRYYYKWDTSTSNNWVAWAMAANTTNMYGHVPFPVTMRSNPSSLDYQGMGWWLGGAVTVFSAVAIAESGTDSCTMNFTSTGLTSQKMYAVLPNGGSNYIAFNSEL